MLVISGYQWLSLVIVGYHWLSLAIVGYHWSSLVIGYQWLSLVIIGYRRYSVPELNDAELNALRYSAGYVPWKLKQKFSQRKDPYCKEYLTCLDGMRESSVDKDVNECVSYMEYTNRWIQLVDRGGLFHISDEVYSFFYEVECLVRKFLYKTRENIVKTRLLMMLLVTVVYNFIGQPLQQTWMKMLAKCFSGSCKTLANNTRVLNSWGIRRAI